MKRNILQVDTFRDLEQIHEKGRDVYFVFDKYKFIPSGEAEKWEKLYYRKINKKDKVIVGRLVASRSEDQ